MKGFSLIEILIYIGVMTLMITSIFSTVYALEHTARRSRDEGRLLHEAMFIEATIQDLLRSSESFSISQDRTLLTLQTTSEEETTMQVQAERIVLSVDGIFSPLHAEQIIARDLEFAVVAESRDGVVIKGISYGFTLSALPVSGHQTIRSFNGTVYLHHE